MVSSDTFSLDGIAEELPRSKAIDEQVHQKFLADYSDSGEVQANVREVFVHFATKIIDLMAP